MSSGSYRLGVLASGGGTNFQAVLARIQSGELPAEVVVVISNNSGSGALRRARGNQIDAIHLSGLTHPDPVSLDRAIEGALHERRVDLVLLAGYMKKLGPRTLERYRDRILNIHPALLPAFGGQGMYGRRVHEAVVASGATESGVTVHLVDEHYDNGPIVAQETVPVEDGDSPETLGARVLELEHTLFPAVVGLFATNRVRIHENQVTIVD
ncbi:MAG: phosphoribosylglycinamide formyltransferase [Gemmatimonadetes bacterium]|nr:phosphoribosylglycinamide formyltransferase [Gemmatimonadota bacterium]